MTLRMALLLVSLILIGLIGLACHFKYRQLNPKNPLKHPAKASQADALLDEQINGPFINENIASDIPQSVDTVLDAVETDETTPHQAPELKTSLEELVDRKKIAQSIAADLLPAYDTSELIFEHAAILPNVKKPAAEIQKAYELLPSRLKKNIELTATVKKQNQFIPLEQVKAKQKVTHLKSEYKLKQKSAIADEIGIKDYETFILELSNQLDCEYQFALTSEEAVNACNHLRSFIKDHDLIIILYILAKPEDTFNGESLKKAVSDAGLNYGEFKFFHFYTEPDSELREKVFSLANMYKPGSFELDSLDKFSTMGLCAFMVPALVKDPLAGFSEMCTRCNKMADSLSGVLTTNKREILDEDNYRHICNLIVGQKTQLNEKGVENGSDIANRLFG